MVTGHVVVDEARRVLKENPLPVRFIRFHVAEVISPAEAGACNHGVIASGNGSAVRALQNRESAVPFFRHR